MNTVAQTLVLLWVAGWTLAMVWAGWRAKGVAVPPPHGKKTPRSPNRQSGPTEDFEAGGKP